MKYHVIIKGLDFGIIEAESEQELRSITSQFFHVKPDDITLEVVGYIDES